MPFLGLKSRQHRAALSEQLPEVPMFLLSRIRVIAVLRYSPPDALDFFHRLRPRA
jgi:hypothetical protein